MEGCGARLSAGVGLIVFAVGLVLAFMSIRDGAPAQQDAIFVAVMVGGLIIMLTSTMQPTITTSGSGRKAPMIDVTSYVAPPGQMRKGYCWQCGRRVRRNNRICTACGATQMDAAPAHEPLSTAPTMERRPATTFMTEADLPVAGAQPPAGPELSPQRVAPRYVPGASGPLPVVSPDPAFNREQKPPVRGAPGKPSRSGLPMRRLPVRSPARPTSHGQKHAAWGDADGDW